jgi:large subunit ribosomal protein L1
MNLQSVESALRSCKEQSKKRKFRQSVELFVNFRGIDFSKAPNRIDLNVSLPFATGKGEHKVLVFAKDKQFLLDVQKKASRVIPENDISSIDKKAAAKLADEFDLLLAEGPVMLTVGKYLGQELAPKGKLPKPIQPNMQSFETALKQVKGSIRVSNKKGKFMPMVHALIGHEQMNDNELAQNALAIYSSLLNVLPGKQQNIKSLVVKLTMGKPVKISEEVKK